MTALAKDRDTPCRTGNVFEDPVAANAKLYIGSLVALNATGFAVPGSTATTLRARGRAEIQVNNTGGADGAITVKVKRGVYKFVNLAADAITRADIGAQAFIVDDQTVARTNGTGTRSVAGLIRQVDSDGAWVEV